MVVEIIVTLLGMCITFAPPIIYFSYLLAHVKNPTKFDIHLEKVTEKKGIIGKIIAYATKIFFGIWVTCMGVVLSVYFESELALALFFISIIIYSILKYFDINNEK